MWTQSTRLRSGERSGCMFGCGVESERDAFAHYIACRNLHGVQHAVADE